MDSIRPERPTDAAAIRRVLDGAFGRAAEGTAVEALRARRALVLSLAALRDDLIIGVIQFTDAHFDHTLEPKWLDQTKASPSAAAPVPPPTARRPARRAEPEVPWVSLEEEFERERREREMEEVLEAARSASKTKPRTPTVMTVAPHATGGTRSPKFVVLAPVAVLPKLQRRGIGSRLVQTGLVQVARMNAEAVFVLGDPAFYGRFGFRSTRPYGIACEMPVREDLFQVRELRPGALEGVRGVVRFEPELRKID